MTKFLFGLATNLQNFLFTLINFLQAYNGAVTAGATALVAVFTVVLALVTNRQAKLTKIVAEAAVKSADAAKLNAEALIDAERATLSAVITISTLKDSLGAAVRWPNSPSMDNELVSTTPAVVLVVKNLGKTPAFVREISYQIIQADEEQHLWNYSLEVVANPIIDAGSQTSQFSCRLENRFTVGDSRQALDGTRPLYFYGRLIFTTSFGRDYEYLWRYENDRTSWVLVHHEQRLTSAGW